MFKVGQHVQGQYYGVAFSGIVSAERFHTVAYNYQWVTIKFDKPIAVFDAADIRKSVMMAVHHETGICEKGLTYMVHDWVTGYVNPNPESEMSKICAFYVNNWR